jgi:hypothetical protein
LVVAGKGRARPWHQGSAMIGGLVLLHKQIQEAGRLCWEARRTQNQAIRLVLLLNVVPAPSCRGGLETSAGYGAGALSRCHAVPARCRPGAAPALPAAP